MKIRSRNLGVLSVLLALIAAIGAAVYLRRGAAPETARLLPESDAVVYVNAELIRRLTAFGDKPVHLA